MAGDFVVVVVLDYISSKVQGTEITFLTRQKSDGRTSPKEEAWKVG